MALVVSFLLSAPTIAFMATVEPFADIHLWLIPIAKNVTELPRVGPPALALHMQCSAFDLGPGVPQIFLFPFLLVPAMRDHLEWPLDSLASELPRLEPTRLQHPTCREEMSNYRLCSICFIHTPPVER